MAKAVGYLYRRYHLVAEAFGLGGDAVRKCLNPDVESTRYMILLNGEAFDSAHNEFLQQLVCGGLVGEYAGAAFW